MILMCLKVVLSSLLVWLFKNLESNFQMHPLWLYNMDKACDDIISP